MIPSTTNRLLITEDWKKIYQSYRNADFKSYDFDTLRRTMITYLREHYPEDFNDFINSSEYIALIELIAYLGQNLSFRIDLNARENFLETAERRESVLRLAKLINYNVKRNVPASGLLKITSVLTTDNVFDNNGNNLSNTSVAWNDPTNLNWYEQFVAVINSSLITSSSFGKPSAKDTIDGIRTELYKVNSLNDGVPIYSVTRSINGITTTFEIVSSTISNTISESDPNPNNVFSLVYRNDNKGSSSSNTGFFVLFKQGTMSSTDFVIDNPVPNEIIGIDTPNINDTDVWLWQLNADGSYPTEPWTRVDSINGNNIIYNSISDNKRNLYTVVTRQEDQIDLNFTDGSFGNLPKGVFRLFYRQSNGLTYTIKPEQMGNISFDIPYKNKLGQTHTLTVIASLQYPVSNSAAPESNEEIKTKAPQAFYSQNRMITAEDYNIVPLTVGSRILKVKSVNRTSSGVSKYFEMSDVSGKYSDVNIFSSDGILYKEDTEYNFEYEINTKNEVKSVLKTKLSEIFRAKEFRTFYFEKYIRPNFTDYTIRWVQSTKATNQTTGYFEINGKPSGISVFSSNNLKYVTNGSLVKFKAPTAYNPALPQGSDPAQQYFLPNGKLTFIQDNTTLLYKWIKVISFTGDGSNNGVGTYSTGIGPVVITGNIPTGAIPVEVIPKFVSVLSSELQNEIVNISMTKRNFGLSFDQDSMSWFIITDTNLNLTSPFSLLDQKNSTYTNRDASWMVAFEWTGKRYRVRYRFSEYIFESEAQTAFFVDSSTPSYDYVNSTVIKDQISVLGINSLPTANDYLKTDQNFQIDSAVIQSDGFQEPKKVKVSVYDKDDDGLVDNPDSFKDIVNSEYLSTQTGFKEKFVYFQYLADGTRYKLADPLLFFSCPTESDVPEEMLVNGQLFYFYDSGMNVIKRWNSESLSFDLVTTYFAKPGRSNLKFEYIHKSPDNRRIDPSKTNLIDVYLLTKEYDTDFRNWLSSGITSEPRPPTSQSLEIAYSTSLNLVKSISDELIFQPVNYKVLFGPKAAPNLQATIKIVRNPLRPVSDNDLKTRVLSSIQNFFSISNWDFGQTFYFSELATYVMNTMTPDITNIVLVPKQDNSFGSLYEIKCQSNEIFVSGTTADDIVVIESITATELKASGSIINTVGGQR